MVWLSAVLFFALFLYHAPMALIVRAAYDSPAGAWVSVGVSLHPLYLERTAFISAFPKRKGGRRMGPAAALRAIHGLWDKRNAQLDVRVEIDAADAAATALLCGGCYALSSALKERVRVRVFAQYGRCEPHFAVRGMLWAKTGHIALAAFAAFRQKRRKENGQETH
ncbi:MAG: hypothetical protein Q4A66_00175 [Eubacteriales bacterium]|nr:hypothetical protein [Eubacteriales bacterium]